MMLALLFSLILVALILKRLKFTSFSYLLFSFIFLFFYLISNGFLPQLLLRYLQNDLNYKPSIHWQNKNIIVLLGTGTIKYPGTDEIAPTFFAYPRIYAAASYFKNCQSTGKQCFVLVSGGDVVHSGVSEAVVYRKALLSLGIQSKYIYLETQSKNTYENAEYTEKLVAAHKIKQVFLVTSGFHMKRAQLYFNYFGMPVIELPSDYLSARISWLPLSYNFFMTDLAWHEVLGVIEFKYVHSK